MGPNDTVIARILIDDQTRLGFNSYARNVERAKKTSEAFRQNAIDKVTQGLENQFKALTKTAREMDVLQASMYGASQAQLDHINKLHDSIDAHNRATVAAEEKRRADEQAALASQKMESAIERVTQDLQFQANTVDMTADEIQIYRLQMMGASAAQIDAVKKVQQATAAMRAQGKSAGALHGQLRLMRGGLGQIGHQVQDVAVQLQMGQNALLVLGQQGSQVASLFGQNGALIGAVLAVGAAVGTYLAPELFKTTDHLKEFEEVANRVAKIMSIDMATGAVVLTDEIIRLAQKSDELAKAKLDSAIVAQSVAINTAVDGIKANAEEFFVGTARSGQVLAGSLGGLRDEFGITTADAQNLAKAQRDLMSGADASGKAFVTLVASIQSSSQATDEQKKAFDEVKSAILANAENMLFGKDALEALTDLQTNYNERINEGSQETKDFIKEQEKYTEMLTSKINALDEELTLLYQGEEAALRLKLANEGVAKSDIDIIVAMQARIDAAKAENEVVDEQIKKEEQLIQDKKKFSDKVLEQARNIGKSSLEMLKAKAAAFELTTELEQAFKKLDEAEAAKKKEESIGDIESLRESLMTEEQALFDSYVKRNQIVGEALANDAISQKAAYELQLQLLADYEKKVADMKSKSTKFEGKTAKDKTKMVLGELGDMFQGVTAANKKMFAVQKAYSIVQTIISTFEGAQKAATAYAAIPPLAAAMAAAHVTAGLARVAQIRAQSFDGGGFTGMGSRSGGMDGKGGFPAILHPNETVVDHTKGQGQGITIVNNVDARGAGPEVDMKIQQAMQVTSQQTIATIQDLMRRRRFA